MRSPFLLYFSRGSAYGLGMDDFRIAGSSFFDERPDAGAAGGKKRRRAKPGEPPEAEPEDAVELSAEAEEPEGGDYFEPSSRDE